MASQIYSRYVPPSKMKNPSAPSDLPPSQASTSQHTVQNSLQPTPPTPQSHASTMYARYVPPPKDRSQPSVQISRPQFNTESPSPAKRKHAEVADVSRESNKRRKEIEVTKEPNMKELRATDNSQDPATGISSERVSGSKKLKQRKPPVETTVSDPEDDKRHKKLIDKRNKSLKRAEKLIESVGDDTEEAATTEVEEELHDLVPLPQPEPIPEPATDLSPTSMPSWLANPIRIPPTTAVPFTDLGINEEVATGLRDKGFKNAFAVQAAVLPLLLPGSLAQDGDVLVSAATGSGKTMAYVLPIAEDLSRNRVLKLRGLIVLPTRELVAQAKEVFEICASIFHQRRRLRIGVAVGNESFKSEQNALMASNLEYDPEGYQNQRKRISAKWEGSDYGSDGDICDDEMFSPLPNHVFDPVSEVDVLICTPGRLVEHLKSTPGFTLDHIQWLVVDEADKLLDQSFQQWLDVVMARLKSPRKVILSATMTRDIGQLNDLKLYRPRLVVVEEEVEISDSLFLPPSLKESAIKVDDEGVKPLYLLEVLKRAGVIPGGNDSLTEDVLSEGPRGALIFTKSNETAVRLGRLIGLLEARLSDKLGILTATTRSSVRKRALKNFESGKLSILIASDLVSRGLDLTNLAHVISYDVPTSVTSYVHRVGRTARAGKSGHAWTLFTNTEGRWVWNEIGRAEGLSRKGKLERVNINVDLFQQDRERYEAVLETLGKEAGGNPIDNE